MEHPDFYGKMKVKNRKREIDIIYKWDKKNKKYKPYTDECKYGDNLEIVFSRDKQCYTIKGIQRLKDDWRKEHGKPVDILERFLEE